MSVIDINEAPRKAKDLYNKALAAFERKNFDYSMDMFMSVLEIEPRLLQARKFLRAAAIGKLKAQNVGSLYHTLSSFKGIGKSMAVNAQLKKNPERALVEAEALMRIDPLNKSFIKTFAAAAMAANMPEAAIQTLEIAKEHYPSDTELMKRLADLYLKIEQAAKGRDVYEEIARLKPNDQKAIKDLKDATAIATLQKGGWEEAQSYRDLIKDTKQAVTLEQQAKSVKSEKDIDDLIVESLAKIEQEPGNINYRRHLAELYLKADNYDKSIETLQAAQAITGGTDPQVDRALSNIHAQRFNKQIETLEAEGRAGEAGEVRKQKQAFMLEDAADRVKRYPNDLQFKYEYGVLLFESDLINEAIQQFQAAQRNPQRRLRALYYLGMCFSKKQRYDVAAEQLEKAASEINIMDNDKKDIVYELGHVYEAMGKLDDAMKRYKEIYAVDIGFKDISEKVEKGLGG